MAEQGSARHDHAGWTFDLADPVVTQLRIDFRFTMCLDGGALVVIEGPFELGDSSGLIKVSPEPWAKPDEILPALHLFNRQITECRADTSGELTVGFDHGANLRVPVMPQYENWQIVLPTGEQWVGTPAGGGVSHHLPGSSRPE